jgi:mannose-6-phosphate isomerase
MWCVRGILRDYDWGEIDGLAQWSHATGTPQAEVWFGIHPAAPAIVVDSEGVATGETLDAVMPPQRNPLLVKLLAAARPLSIQVHPARALAAELSARGALPDSEEKTEILMALEPFRIHAGWRDLDLARRVLVEAGVPEEAISSSATHADTVRTLLDLSPGVIVQAVAQLSEAAKTCGYDDAAVESLRSIAAEFPTDAGALVCVMMQHSVLAPGQTIGVSAGIIHSYVRGLGVEVMTSSDNVLRLGLTSKTLNVDDALAALCDVQPTDGSNFPFFVRELRDEARVLPASYRVVIPLEGHVEASGPQGQVQAAVGCALVMGEHEAEVTVRVRGRAIVAEGR